MPHLQRTLRPPPYPPPRLARPLPRLARTPPQTARRMRTPGLTLAALVCAGVASAEPVNFPAASVEPTPFAIRLAESRGTTAKPTPGDMIAGDIYKPDGAGPFPAIIALHGCEGWPKTAAARQTQATRYIQQGYVFLEVDSFGPRNIEQACVAPRGDPPADRPGDALGALDWLTTQPFVDASKVALAGASQGGSAVLFVLSKDAPASRHHFAAGIAFYPACSPSWATTTAPTLILVGALDDWSPAYDCQLMADLPHPGAPQTLLIFPAAHHAFNGPSLRTHPRDIFGHHLEYNEAATTAANAATTEFLARYLKH